MRSRLFGVLALLLLIALPVSAADRVVQNGIDPWHTAGNGSTFINFAKSPVPAGFFCPKSAPFTERVVFRGVPLATAEKGVLGNTDTIVQRLDDAVFNKKGVATTRVQVRALHFESVKPIETACGTYRVEVHLNGEQPITRMRIVREGRNGGRFYAPIAVNGKVVFTAVGGATREILEISQNVRFPANQGIRWSEQVGRNGVQKTGFILVDTDNDRLPDTHLPGTSSSFAAGWAIPAGQEAAMPVQVLDCHLIEDTEGHCPGGPIYY